MAKKSSRILIGLICEACQQQNYITVKSKVNSQEPLKLTKYCKKCKQTTQHKEKKKLD